jgi:hypothetical protein
MLLGLNMRETYHYERFLDLELVVQVSDLVDCTAF